MNVLIFGSNGSIGREIVKTFRRFDYNVFKHSYTLSLDSLCLSPNSIDAVVWAQGVNAKDSISSYSKLLSLDLFDANLFYILDSLKFILDKNYLNHGAKLCIISSIWQSISRDQKLSYILSKSSLSGLSRSLSIDLGDRDIKVNLVSPGVVDTPMSKKNMSDEQLADVISQTPLGRLATTMDVANVVYFLCSPLNSFVTGQNVVVDGGFSFSRVYE